MFKERLWKVVAGFVLAAVLLLPASRVLAGEIRPGVSGSLQSLWQVWVRVVSAFGLAEDSPAGEVGKGPAIDPNGAASEAEEDKGPRIDPLGLTSEPGGEVGPRIAPRG